MSPSLAAAALYPPAVQQTSYAGGDRRRFAASTKSPTALVLKRPLCIELPSHHASAGANENNYGKKGTGEEIFPASSHSVRGASAFHLEREITNAHVAWEVEAKLSQLSVEVARVWDDGGAVVLSIRITAQLRRST